MTPSYSAIPSLYPFTPLDFLHGIFHPTFHYILWAYSHQRMQLIFFKDAHLLKQQLHHPTACLSLVPARAAAHSRHLMNIFWMDKWMTLVQNRDFNSKLSISKTHAGSFGLVLLSLQKENIVLALKQTVHLVLSLSKQLPVTRSCVAHLTTLGLISICEIGKSACLCLFSRFV